MWSLLPFDYTHGPVFLTRKTEVQALLPPHTETRERCYPWMPQLVTERSISRLLCLFPSKNPFSPFPSHSLPLPSLSLFRFLASHRLAESQARVVGGGWSFILVPTTLCWMGGWVGARKSGANEGKGRGGKREGWWEVVDFQYQYEVSQRKDATVASKESTQLGNETLKHWNLPLIRSGICLDSEEYNFEAVHAFHTYCNLATETVAMEKSTYYSTGSIIPFQQDGGTSCWGFTFLFYSNTSLTRKTGDDQWWPIGQHKWG